MTQGWIRHSWTPELNRILSIYHHPSELALWFWVVNPLEFL